MKKMMLLAGLLCVFGLGYAEEEPRFTAKANIVKPIEVSLDKTILDFGEIIAGQTDKLSSINDITVTLTGKANETVKIEYSCGGSSISNGKIALKNGENTLNAVLYSQTQNQSGKEDVLSSENFYPLADGITTFKIKGDIVGNTNVPEGEYVSDPIVLKVVY